MTSERIEEDGYITIRRSGKEKLSDHIDIKEDNWSVGSKKKLKVSMRHKMKRIFVGILDMLDNERNWVTSTLAQRTLSGSGQGF